MACLELNHTSSVLGKTMPVHVILPEAPPLPQDERYPALWMFHGRGETSETWLQHDQLPELAETYGCALVMPTVDNTRYADAVNGGQNWTYVSRELPDELEARLPLATTRERRFATGFSIGGLCALKLGIARSERFAAVCSLSGALHLSYPDLLASAADNPDRVRWLKDIYGPGPDFAKSEDRLVETAKAKCQSGVTFPRIQLRCGRQDGSSYLNRQAQTLLRQADVHVDYQKTEGRHDRAYCDKELAAVFRFLAL